MAKPVSISRALELLAIEERCIKRASGLQWNSSEQKWMQTDDICDRDCEHCDLVQDPEELLEMYGLVQYTIHSDINMAELKAKLKERT